VVFRDFARRVTPDDKARSVPWIGISPEFGSCIAFVLSMLIVPFGVGYLAWRGIHITSRLSIQLLYAGSVFASGVLVAAILLHWKTVFRVRG
jgi:hypothetical protein